MCIAKHDINWPLVKIKDIGLEKTKIFYNHCFFILKMFEDF